MMRFGRPAFVSALMIGAAGCSAPAGDWVKAGADEAATASAYQDCAALTADATRTDADINQDIAASRASDLQRSGLLRAQSQQNRENDSGRVAAILTSCMNAKGFTRR